MFSTGFREPLHLRHRGRGLHFCRDLLGFREHSGPLPTDFRSMESRRSVGSPSDWGRKRQRRVCTELRRLRAARPWP